MSVVDGYTYIDHHSWDAYNEYTDFDAHISLYEERFGRKPLRFFADKIYMTKENRRKLKDLGIQCMGARLGRPPKVKYGLHLVNMSFTTRKNIVWKM